MKVLVDFVHSKKPEFLMIGEMLHGDYTQLVNPELLDSVTNYECYKGLYSSFNTHNMHEIGYSLNRQFGPEEWTLYKGLPLYNFVDNHDVERIASQLEDKEHLPLIYAMEFAMPGVPGVYYGSEWGYKKVPYTELTTTADTEADNESSTGEGAASPGTGHAVNATDGVITSYYHSCYSGDNQPNREDGALTGNNTITVELQNAQSIQGITYLPRQDAFGNGTVTEFSVSVQKDGR